MIQSTAMQYKLVLPVSFLLLAAVACRQPGKNAAAKRSAVSRTIPGSFNPHSGIPLDSHRISAFLEENPLFKPFARDFDTFYRNNQYNYAWYNKQGLIETANALIGSLESVTQEGVTATIPYKDTLESLLHSPAVRKPAAPDLYTELMLTGEYFFYARNIWSGALNDKTDSVNWYIPRKQLSYASLLEQNLKTGTLADLSGPVVGPQYQGLKQTLAAYREAGTRQEVTVPANPNARFGVNDSADLVVPLRQRLYQLGFTGDTTSGSRVYDTALARVVRAAKESFGLKADASLTAAFIAELNIPLKQRIEQIMVNMERLRWIPADSSFGSEFILVNIPEYRLHYFRNDRQVWDCGVVVGRPMTQTVVFSGKMQYVVFSPYWNVPPSIIEKEVKPGMKRNPNYLAAHNMEWNNGLVRQKPGPSNSLGLVKFLFPNSNNIYLHDTPAKSLFSEDNRAFSHGCVRVADPKKLAMLVLEDYPQWTPEAIDKAMHGGVEKTVVLKKKIPVYIGYFTAFVGANGKINFRKDVYKRDDQLFRMLARD